MNKMKNIVQLSETNNTRIIKVHTCIYNVKYFDKHVNVMPACLWWLYEKNAQAAAYHCSGLCSFPTVEDSTLKIQCRRYSAIKRIHFLSLILNG
jgi:hypothetical protein